MQGFLGRRIVAVAFLSQAVAIGFAVAPFSLFAQPVADEFGTGMATLGLAFGVMMAMIGLASPLVGIALDRGSIRWVMIGGAVLNGASLLLLSVASAPWQMWLFYCGTAAAGTAMLGPLASSTLTANWFERRRGQALGIVNMGAPAGAFLVAPVAGQLVPQLGWRQTLVYFGVATMVLAIPPIWLLVVDRPGDVGQAPDGVAGGAAEPAPAPGGHGPSPAGESDDTDWTPARLAASRNFWSLAACVGTVFATGLTMNAHLVPFAAELGMSVQRASVVLAFGGGAAILGTLAFGSLADRVDQRRLLWASIAIQAGSWLLLWSGPGFALLVAAVIALGACTAGIMPIFGAVIGRLFGPAAFGRVMGTTGIALAAFGALFPWAAGRFKDVTGSYAPAFAGVIAALMLAALALVFLRGPARAPEPAAPSPVT